MSVDIKENYTKAPANQFIPLFLLSLGLGAWTGCSTGEVKSAEDEATFTSEAATQAAAAAAQAAENQAALKITNQKLKELEGKVTNLSDKLESSQKMLEQLAKAKNPGTSSITENPSKEFGGPIGASLSSLDPSTGFINDEAIQSFRKALITFRGQGYTESVLAFSDFLEKYPDHPLAGSAQFYVGESYFKLNEYKLAVQEYSRVLASYDRSTHVADTLRNIAIAEDALSKNTEAAKHRQLLTSLFPQSPAAWAGKPNSQVDLQPKQEASPSSDTPASSSESVPSTTIEANLNQPSSETPQAPEPPAATQPPPPTTPAGDSGLGLDKPPTAPTP